MDRLLMAIIAVAGVPAAMVIYIAVTEWFLERLPEKRRPGFRPWFWVGPASLLLIFYLVYPTLNTIYLSLLDARSELFVGLLLPSPAPLC